MEQKRLTANSILGSSHRRGALSADQLQLSMNRFTKQLSKLIKDL